MSEIEEDELDDPADYPVRVILPALGQRAPAIKAPRSVFELGVHPVVMKLRAGMSPPPQPGRGFVLAEEGTTRFAGTQYPSNRWDLQRQEKERQRRARQRPPKPTKAARTKGRKLAELTEDE